MAKRTTKPELEGLTWSMREVVDPGTPVGPVTCALGSIVFGGASLYRVPPRTWEVQYRGLPEPAQMPISIAMEPRPPFRVAVGAQEGDVVIFTDTTTSSSIMVHGFTEKRGSKQAVQLAWLVHEGQSSLFARTDDGGLYRMQAEGFDELEVPPVHAIAHDEGGGFAALTVVDGTPKVMFTPDGGESWYLRPLGVEVEAAPDAPAFMALAGPAVAVVVGDSGPLVSRRPDQPATRYPALSRAYALAFQGSDPDGWIYVAQRRTEAEPAAVSLLTAEGNVLKVMDFLCEDREPFDLGAIAWDSARKALLLATRQGLVAMGLETPKRPRAGTPAVKKKAAKKPLAKKPLATKKTAKKPITQ